MERSRGEAMHTRVRRILDREPHITPTIDDYTDVANLITWGHQLASEAARALRKLADDATVAVEAGHSVPTINEAAEVLRMSPLDFAQLSLGPNPTKGSAPQNEPYVHRPTEAPEQASARIGAGFDKGSTTVLQRVADGFVEASNTGAVACTYVAADVWQALRSEAQEVPDIAGQPRVFGLPEEPDGTVKFFFKPIHIDPDLPTGQWCYAIDGHPDPTKVIA